MSGDVIDLLEYNESRNEMQQLLLVASYGLLNEAGQRRLDALRRCRPLRRAAAAHAAQRRRLALTEHYWQTIEQPHAPVVQLRAQRDPRFQQFKAKLVSGVVDGGARNAVKSVPPHDA